MVKGVIKWAGVFVAVLLIAVVTGITPVNAQSSNNDAVINQLLEMIAQLQAQISELQQNAGITDSQVTPVDTTTSAATNNNVSITTTTQTTSFNISSATGCSVATIPLFPSHSNTGAVLRLQQFLMNRPEANWPAGQAATGFYGDVTTNAVRNFQRNHGIVSGGTFETTGYGLVGPSTRAKLNSIACSGNSNSSSGSGSTIYVYDKNIELSPDRGRVGQTIIVKGRSNSITPSGNTVLMNGSMAASNLIGDADLEQGFAMLRFAIPQYTTGPVCSKSSNGLTICPDVTPYRTVVYPGVYSVQIMNSRGERTNAAKLEVVGSVTGNSYPRITDMTVTSPVVSGDPVVMLAKATDADGDTLSWSYDWGDGTSGSADACTTISRCLELGETHTYELPGTYAVTLKVSDSRGGTDSVTKKVLVEDKNTLGIRGDCNMSGSVDFQDVDAIRLEIFDGDGTSASLAAGGSYKGSPVGCDANADRIIDSADSACAVLLINGRSCGVSGGPIITGVSGPTQIDTNERGTWSVSARDPEGGTLSYRVVWGDEQQKIIPDVAHDYAPYLFSQTATFTHTFSRPGTYTSTFLVRDVDGNVESTSITTRVTGDGSNAPAVTVLSPDGADSFRAGDQIKIQWKTEGIARNPMTQVDIMDDRIDDYIAKSLFGTVPALNHARIIASSGDTYTYEYIFIVPDSFDSSLPSRYQGIYGGDHYHARVTIVTSGTPGTATQRTVSDQNVRPFEIRTGFVSTAPSLEVVDPQGNEVFVAGSGANISLKSRLTTQTAGTLTYYLVSDNENRSHLLGSQTFNQAVRDMITEMIRPIISTYKEGSYHVNATWRGTDGSTLWDDSQSFSIEEREEEVGELIVRQPFGGEEYKIGDTVNVEWDYPMFENERVVLYLSDAAGNSTYSITQGSVSTLPFLLDGRYNWTIPEGVPLGNHFLTVGCNTILNQVCQDASAQFRIVDRVVRSEGRLNIDWRHFATPPLIHPGDTEQIDTLRLVADSAEDVRLRAFSLVAREGRAAIDKIELYLGSTKIAEASESSNQRYNFVMASPLSIPRNSTVSLHVKVKTRGDITQDETTIRLALDPNAVIEATGASSGGAVDTTVTSQSSTGLIVRRGGEISLSFTTQSGNDLVQGKHTLFRFSARADGENVRVEQFGFDFDQAHPILVERLYVVDSSNGQILGSTPASASFPTDARALIPVAFMINSGDSMNFEVVADIGPVRANDFLSIKLHTDSLRAVGLTSNVELPAVPSGSVIQYTFVKP